MKLEKKIFVETLEKISSKHGIVFFGISGLDTSSDFIRYKKWLAEGKHAGMKYLEENLNLRKDPTQLLPGSKTALVLVSTTIKAIVGRGDES